MSHLKHLVLACLIALIVLLSGPTVQATTKFDAVSARINGDLTTIDTFMTVTSDSKISYSDFMSELDKLDDRLLVSIEMYHDLTDFSDPAIKTIQPEIKELTRHIEGVHYAIVDLRKGFNDKDEVAYHRGMEELDHSLKNIDATMIKIQEKEHSEMQKDANTELIYIVGSITSVAVAIGLFYKSRKPQTTEKMKLKANAYTVLFKQALAPMAGFLITLGSFEYAKYTNSTSYTIFTGLLIMGVVYFALASGRYLFKQRPAIQKLA